jgi:hypothetical protein
MSNEPTTEQKNEAIALFMGGSSIKEHDGYRYVYYKTSCARAVSELKYHVSWDWLMPVIERISKMPLLNVDNTPCTDPQDVCYPRTFGMPTEDGKQVMFRFNGWICHEADTLIEAAHAGVYEVANYENNQSPTTNG